MCRLSPLMERRRPSVLARSMSVDLRLFRYLLIVAVTACFALPAKAESKPRYKDDQLEFVAVPESFPPPDGYALIKKKEFDKLWNQRTTNQAEEPVFSRTEYRIRFDANELTDKNSHHQSFVEGTFTGEVFNATSENRFLKLAPLNILLTDLEFESSPTVWGTVANDQIGVMVPSSGQLTGSWAVTTRSVHENHLYQFYFPPSAVTQLRITLPDNISLTLEEGVLRTEESSRPAHRDWILSLPGSIATFKLQYAGGKNPDETESSDGKLLHQLLSEESHRYKIKQESLSISSEIAFNVHRGSLEKIELMLSPGLEVTSLRYGEVENLFWEEVSRNEEGSLIQILFPEKIKGDEHRIKVESISKLPTNPGNRTGQGARFPLPEVKLLHSLVLDGTWEVDITPPLELRDHEGENLQLMYINEGQLTTLRFQQLSQDAGLEVEVGFPSTKTDLDQVCALSREEGEWNLTTEISITCTNGVVFDYDFQIPTSWDIVDVQRRGRAATESNATVQWSVGNDNPTSPSLYLNFADGIAEGESASILIKARTQVPNSRTHLPFPVFRSDRSPLDTLIQLVPSSLIVSSDELVANANVKVILRDDLPQAVRDFDVVKASSASDQNVRIFQFLDLQEIPSFRINRPEQPVQVEIETTYIITDTDVNERVNIQIIPTGTQVSKVYLFRGDKSSTFDLQLAPPNRVTTVPQSASAFSYWALPSRGTLWEATITPPQTGPFRLSLFNQINRNQFFENRLPLLTVPGAVDFKGTFRLQNNSSTPIRMGSINESNLFDLGVRPANAPPSQVGPSSDNIAYNQQLSDAFTPTNLSAAPDSDELPTARLKLFTTVGVSDDSVQRYTAIYDIPQTNSKANLTLQWPDEIQVISSRIGNRKLNLATGVDIPLEQFAGGDDLVIRYQIAEQQAGLFTRQFPAKLPQISLPVCDVEWYIETPSHEYVTAISSGTHSFQKPTGAGFWDSLWGPLSRFSPVRKRQAELNYTTRSDKLTSDQTHTYLFSSMHLPTDVTFVVTNSIKYYLIGFMVLFAAGLLTGVVCRLAGVNRNRICAGLIVAVLGLHILLPTWFSLPLGALLSGIILGWGVYVCLQRLKLRTRDDSDELEIPVGSTQAYPLIHSLIFFLVAMHLSSIAIAQPPLESPEELDDLDNTRIIYVYPQAEGEDAYYYVSQDLNESLRERVIQPDLTSPAWIKRADYRVDVTSLNGVSVLADYVVSVPEAESEHVFLLPLDPTVAIQYCHINGQSYDYLIPMENGFRLAIDRRQLPAIAERPAGSDASPAEQKRFRHRTFHVQVKFIPQKITVTDTNESREVTFDIPPVADSRMTIHSDLVEEFLFLNGTELKQSSGAGKSYDVNLGSIDSLNLRWASDWLPEREYFLCERQSCLAQLYPTRVELAYRVQYQWNQEIRFEPETSYPLSWKVPQDLILKRVRVDGTPINIESIFVDNRSARFNEFQLDIVPNDRMQSIEVEAEFVMPNVATNDGEPVDVSIYALDSQLNATSLENFYIGFLRRPDIDLRMTNPSQSKYAQPDNDEIRQLFPDQSLKALGRIHQVVRGKVLDIQLQNINQVRSTLPEQEAIGLYSRYGLNVEPSRIKWSYTGRVTPQENQETICHDLTISEAVDITSVQINKSAVGDERPIDLLGHWVRSGDKLKIYLNQPVNTEYQILINGDYAYTQGTNHLLPVIDFKRLVERSDSELQIVAPNTFQVDVEVPTSGNLTGSRNQMSNLWNFTKSAPPTITLRQQEAIRPFKSLTSIQPSLDSNNAYDVRIDLHVPARTSKKLLRLLLPVEFSKLLGQKSFVSNGVDFTVIPEPQNEQLVLEANLPQEIPVDLVATVKFQIPVPINETWSIGSISLVSDQPVENYLAIDNEALLVNNLAGLSEISEDVLQKDRFLMERTDPLLVLYRLTEGLEDIEFSRSIQKTTRNAQFYLQHVKCQIVDHQTVLGQTTIAAMCPEVQNLPINWETGYKLTGITTNNHSHDDYQIDENTLLVAVPKGLVYLTLYWEAPLQPYWFGLGRKLQRVPTLQSVNAPESLLSLSADEDFLSARGDRIEPLPAAHHEFNRLEDLLAVYPDLGESPSREAILSEISGLYASLLQAGMAKRNPTEFKKLEIEFQPIKEREKLPRLVTLPVEADIHVLLRKSLLHYELDILAFSYTLPVRAGLLILFSGLAYLAYGYLSRRRWWPDITARYGLPCGLIVVGSIWWKFWILTFIGPILILAGLVLFVIRLRETLIFANPHATSIEGTE